MSRRPPTPARARHESGEPHSPGRRLRLKGILAPLAVFLLALTIRLNHVFALRGTPVDDILLIDSETYDRLARLAVRGSLRGEEAYAINVLYPWFLAGCYSVAGGAKLAALIVQCAIDSATCVLVWLAARRLFDRTVAVVAGVAAALYAPMVFYAGALLTPTLITFLAAATMFLLVVYRGRPRGGAAVAAGLVAGVATLGRGNHLLLVPLALPLFTTSIPQRRRGLRHWLLFAVAALAAPAVVTVRNYTVERHLVPVAANYAAFYIGHYDGATGLYAMPSFTESARFESEVWGTREMVSRAFGRPVTLAESSRWLFGEALRWIAAHPKREFELAATKIFYFWNRTESATNLSFYFARDFSPPLRRLPLDFGVVGPLMLLGLWLSRRDAPRAATLQLFVALNLITAMIFFVSAEYRLPMIPAGLVLAAWAATALATLTREAWRSRSGRAWGRLAVALMVLAFATVLVNVRTPRLRAQSLKRVDYLDFGRLYLQRGDLVRARQMLERSRAIDPQYAPALESLAELGRLEGDEVAAARMRAAAAPGGAETQDRLLELARLYRSGRWSDALRGFDSMRVEAVTAGDTALALRMLNNIGLCRYKMRDLAGAESTFVGILSASPAYAKAWNNLGLVREARGRGAEAREAYARALGIEPSNVLARRALERLERRADR